MELLYHGKTKDVYDLAEDKVRLHFKDDVTGKDGIFDPGENQVSLQIKGAGKAALMLSEYYFNLLHNHGIKTHYITSDLKSCTMDVYKAKTFGQGLEVICRYRAYGSFLRRYGLYTQKGQELNAFVEVTIKDDKRQDPPISKDALVQLGILSDEDYEEIKEKTQEISQIIRQDLEKLQMDLYDIKLEFGRLESGTEIILIDEVSAGNMRVFQDGKPIDPIELAKKVVNLEY